MKRILTLMAVGLVMAAMMALGAGAALADKGGGGHTKCDNTGCQWSGGGGSREGGGGGNVDYIGGEISGSGGGGSREGGGGNHFHLQGPHEDQQFTSSGGSGGNDGGGGGMCEGAYNGYTDTLNITEEHGSSAPYPCKSF